VEGWRRWLRLVVLLTLVFVLYFTLPIGAAPDRSEAFRITISAGLIAVLAAGVIWQVRLQMMDKSRHVDGLVLVLALAIVAFAVVFYGIEQQSPAQIEGLHTRLDSLYFTVTTLMTIGFGDVHAVGQVARGVVIVQIVFNVAVIATAATTISSRVREKAIEHAQTRAASGAPSEHLLRRRRGGGQDRSTHRKPT
jgi:voltage-gated potassium channel